MTSTAARPTYECFPAFPCSADQFPVRAGKIPCSRAAGIWSATPSDDYGIRDPESSKWAEISGIPCYFPCSQFFTGRCPTRRGPNIASLELRRRHRGRPFLGAAKPVSQLDPGFPEYPRLSPRTFIGPGARLLEFLFTGPHADAAQQGGNDGTVASAVLRS